MDRRWPPWRRLRHDALVDAGLRSAPPRWPCGTSSERLGPGQLALIEVLAVDDQSAQAVGSVRDGDPRQMAAMMMLIAQSAVQSAQMVSPILDEDALDAEFTYLLNG